MKELLLKRAKAFEQGRALVLKAESESRALTGEEVAQYDTIMVDVEALGRTIERSRQSAELSAELDRSIGPASALTAPVTRTGSDLRDAAMDAFLRNGTDRMNQEFRDAFGQVITGRDSLHFRAASPLSDITGTAGAYTVPQGFLAQLEVAQKAYGGIRNSRATILKTATGNPLPYPNLNDTFNSGEIVAENAPISQAVTEMSFGRITLGAFKYSSKLVLVPIELMQDSAFDVQAFVSTALGIRLGRIQNKHFTVGTGTTQPWGVVTAAASGTVAPSGQSTSWNYPSIVNLVHSVDPAYRVAAEFMMADSTAAVIETMVDGNGRPLLNSSFVGIGQPVTAGQLGKANYTLLGYPVVINQDMPSMAASAKSVLFGDMSKFLVRDVLDLMLIRFGELYMGNGQIGFTAFMRSDSALQDAGSGPIKTFSNSSS